MKVKVVPGDVLDADEAALCLSIDGNGVDMEGNIARQFARRWPALWQEIRGELRLPIPLGQVFEFEVPTEYEDCQFGLVVLVSTLHHRETLSDQQKRAVVFSALLNVFDVLPRYAIASCATTLMRGGWRMSQDHALLAMNDAVQSAAGGINDLELSLYARDADEFQRLSGLALTLGWDVSPGP